MTITTAIRERVRLAMYTTLQIGGPARFFIEAFTEEDVVEAANWATEHSQPLFVLGGGSNVLISDEGFSGLVVRVSIRGIASRAKGNKMIVTAGAGEDWDKFVAWCIDRHLSGIECLSGIPGFVGGTPIQNVGAYGQEVSETISCVRAWDRQKHVIAELSNKDCGFSYRSSVFNTTERNRYIVLSVTFALTMHGKPELKYADLQKHFAERGGTPSLQEVREAVCAIRASKGMLIVPGDPDCHSAGSFFKNPLLSPEQFAAIEQTAKKEKLLKRGERVPHFDAPEEKIKVPAAWLIEKTGFQKGFNKGRVGISTRHTLAIVNRNGGTANDVLRLMREIQEKVLQQFGVKLVPEPVFVSDDGW